MNSSNNNKWLTENPLLKNKDQRYYYDFGTGNKIEREAVKEERNAFLEAASKNSNKPIQQEKDDFLEGFNDPYGEKKEQEWFREEDERKERFAKIRANADNRTWYSQSASTSQTDPWGPSFGGDLKSDEDKKVFLEGFLGKNERPQNKTQNKDAIEFGVDSETYKILQDLSKRWYATSDSAEKERLHGVAEEVRRLARGNNRVKYGTDEIFNVMHKNAKTGQLVKGLSLGTIPVKSVLTNPLLASVSGNLLEPGAFLTAMALDKNQWNYKYQDEWHPKETYIDKNDGSRRYDGKHLDLHDQKNYIPWIYFDGYLIGADKFGNMNMAYVGKKMDLPEWVYKNFETMDDPEDIFWIDKGTELAESGR